MSSQEEIKQALDYIDPQDRDKWMRVGAAIKTELGDEGFVMWNEWSRRADNYRLKSAKEVWRSLKVGYIRSATLFYLAKIEGYSVKRPTLSIEEQQRARAQREAQYQRIAAARAKEADAAKKSAQKLWFSAQAADPCHPYLVKKNIADKSVLSALKQIGQDILVPHQKVPYCADSSEPRPKASSITTKRNERERTSPHSKLN